MRRKIDANLAAWKVSTRRKPLVVNGARQVGKTYSIMHFGNQSFSGVAHVDFSANRSFAEAFEQDIAPSAVLPQLEALLKRPISPSETLIFFDEVQACPRALASLKYFNEQAPEYHIIAAGSLLGVALARDDYSFPVGKVDMLPMNPMDFEEFLWAQGEDGLCALIYESYDRNERLGIHEHAMNLYRKYLIVGGMPEAVSAHARGASSSEVRSIQAHLADAYLADMTKYAQPYDSAKVLAVWNSVPEQLAKENHKFQYATIAPSARAHQYEAAISWLNAAGLVNFCYRVKEAVRPLKAQAEHDFFKLYLLDVGLLGMLMGMEEADLLPAANKLSRVRGGIAENYVMQQLVAARVQPCYWGVASKAEVDFVIQDNAGIIPIEVKSGGNVSARSLEAYRKAFDPPFVMRLSTKNFGFEKGIKSVPLYAAFCIGPGKP